MPVEFPKETFAPPRAIIKAIDSLNDPVDMKKFVDAFALYEMQEYHPKGMNLGINTATAIAIENIIFTLNSSCGVPTIWRHVLMTEFNLTSLGRLINSDIIAGLLTSEGA